MTQLADKRTTDQRTELYWRTMTMMDAVFELPPWWSVHQWSYDDVEAVIERCQLALDDVERCVEGLGVVGLLGEASRAARRFARSACSQCHGDIDVVRAELMLRANQ